MEQRSIIGTPPNPFKKGGPPSLLDECRRDGEEPQETFVLESQPPEPSKETPKEKEKE